MHPASKLLAVLLTACSTLDLAAATTRPNVLFLAVDDLKPALGCYGDPLARTPNIDRLAARGVRFDRAYVNQAVCSPSRNALLLGIRPQTLGIYDLPTHFRDAYPNAVSFTQTFIQNGYSAEGLGKIWHTGGGNRDDALSWTVPFFAPKGAAYINPSAERKGPPTESAEVPDNAYLDGKTVAEVVKRLDALKGRPEQPFLMMVGFRKPHLPFTAPKKYWDQFDPASFPLPERKTAPDGAPEYAAPSGGELKGYEGMQNALPVSDQAIRHLIHGYYASTSFVDAQIGKVLDALDATGLAKNTVIVLWGDHGFHLGDHGFWCKHSNYEQATRIPIIITAPGMKSGASSSALVETVDVYPTLLELTGQSLPPGFDGMALEGASLVPLLRDPSGPSKSHVLSIYPRGPRLGRAVRTVRYRLVEWKVPGTPADSAEFELYDYETDPLETKNLAAEKPAVVRELSAILSTYPEARKQVVAPAPAKAIGPASAKNDNGDT